MSPLFVEKGSAAEAAREKEEIIKLLAGISKLDFIASPADHPKGAIGAVGKGYEAFVVVGEGVDPAQLAARFVKEIEKETQNVARLEGKLANANFVANAPVDIVALEREKLAEMRRRIAKLGSYVEDLK